MKAKSKRVQSAVVEQCQTVGGCVCDLPESGLNMEATVTKAGPQEVLMKVTTRDLQNKRLIAMVQIVSG